MRQFRNGLPKSFLPHCGTPLVHFRERPRLDLQELDQLRARAAKKLSSVMQVDAEPIDRIENFRKQRRKIVVSFADRNSPVAAARFPEQAR